LRNTFGKLERRALATTAGARTPANSDEVAMRKKLPLLLLLLTAPLAGPAAAETLTCPDLASAVQVATCPSEEELNYTYIGFCSDNARLYGRDGDTCESFDNYRKVKNIALWESADGRFSGYLSCNGSADSIRAARPLRMATLQLRNVTQLVCEYGEGISLTYRTRAQCTVEEDCSGGTCKARCE
jgi:hypothetical protein